MIPGLRLAFALLAVGLVLTGCSDEPAATATAGDGATLPAPDSALPRRPRPLARALERTRAGLYAAIGSWRRAGDPARRGIPRPVQLLALRQQRIYRLLAARKALSRAVLAQVPGRLRAEVRDNFLAPRELGQIVSVKVGPPPTIVVGAAQPADRLRAYYRRAFRRFGVGPRLLAAINFVESAFGRLRNRSVSGAKGPMQFIPPTWEAYGLGGDVSDPRDAVLGAANYLHANGAPGDEARALYRYNPSSDYVRAVSRYARRLRADWRAFYAYYAWAVYVGGERLTGPGRQVGAVTLDRRA